MDIFLTNNLTNKKEQFVPIDKKNIGMYVCGPTVYDDPHIGNARPLVIFDILFKLLKSKFENVSYVRNITDIDDKIIKSSEEQKISTKKLTDKVTKIFGFGNVNICMNKDRHINILGIKARGFLDPRVRTIFTPVRSSLLRS